MAATISRYIRLWNSLQTLQAARSLATEAAPSPAEARKWASALNIGCKRNDLQAAIDAFQRLARHGCDPNQTLVSAVLHVCGERADESSFRLVDEYIRSKDSGWRENEQLYNSLVLYKCKVGDVQGARDIFEEMRAKKIKIRHGALWMLLEGAVRQRDLEYTEELLKMCAGIGVPAPIGEQLLQLATAERLPVLATDLIGTYANLRRSVEREVADMFAEWLSR